MSAAGSAGLPSYGELPAAAGAPAGSSWDLWDDGNLAGTLNLLTPERVRRASACIRTGRVFPLDHDLTVPDPPVFQGRRPLRHEVVSSSGRAFDDVISDFNTQSSTQWDGFRHFPHPDHGFYGGLPGERHGVGHWAGRGIAGRAVVADLDRWAASRGRPLHQGEHDPIGVGELEACLAAQQVGLEEGDILLLRTGWLRWYRELPAPERPGAPGGPAPASPGLEPVPEMAAWLWDHHVAAVAADNPALEAWPPHRQGFMLHPHLLALLGIPIGELFDLEALAADCAAAGTYDAFFTSAPLHLPGGAASPPNALAIR